MLLLQMFQDMWCQFSCHWQHKWECYANTDKPFELFEQMSLMTLDTIMKCAFSYKSNCQTKRWDLFPFSDDGCGVAQPSVKMNWDWRWMDGWMDDFPWYVSHWSNPLCMDYKSCISFQWDQRIHPINLQAHPIDQPALKDVSVPKRLHFLPQPARLQLQKSLSDSSHSYRYRS